MRTRKQVCGRSSLRPLELRAPDQPLPRSIAASECGILTQIKKRGTESMLMPQ
jgi:hypothetical protein